MLRGTAPCLAVLFAFALVSSTIAQEDAPEFPPVFSSEAQTITAIMADGSPRPVQYGLTGEDDAVVQGDIILGPGLEMEQYAVGDSPFEPPSLFGLFRRGQSFLWPKGRVRYLYSSDFKLKDIVEAAIIHWEGNTSIHFEKLSQASGNYVMFVNSTSGCLSYPGMQGGRQYIKLGEKCHTGNAIHEIGHAIGLGHEHMRSDRDKYVTFISQNVKAGLVYNFAIDQLNFRDTTEPYCYRSIMHYSETGLGITKNGVLQKTLVPKEPVLIGQRDGLHQCDIDAVQEMYSKEFAKRDADGQ